MISTCFAPRQRSGLPADPLRQWAHMLGFRGHFSTKSRHYSTTLGALRQARADTGPSGLGERRGLPDPAERETLTVGEWRYAGSGYRHGEHLWAELIRQRIATARRIARERDGESRPDLAECVRESCAGTMPQAPEGPRSGWAGGATAERYCPRPTGSTLGAPSIVSLTTDRRQKAPDSLGGLHSSSVSLLGGPPVSGSATKVPLPSTV